MAEAGVPMTSDEIASRMSTDPAVVRRTMAGLRNAGIVRSEKGHGGGWSLERELENVTMRDVHEALGITDLFTIGARTESPRCLVEQTVHRAMKGALDVAESALLEQLGGVNLAAIAADVAMAIRGANARAPRGRRKATAGR
jgi:DNA-binding IscR family transcriptional regulator